MQKKQLDEQESAMTERLKSYTREVDQLEKHQSLIKDLEAHSIESEKLAKQQKLLELTQKGIKFVKHLEFEEKIDFFCILSSNCNSYFFSRT